MLLPHGLVIHVHPLCTPPICITKVFVLPLVSKWNIFHWGFNWEKQVSVLHSWKKYSPSLSFLFCFFFSFLPHQEHFQFQYLGLKLCMFPYNERLNKVLLFNCFCAYNIQLQHLGKWIFSFWIIFSPTVCDLHAFFSLERNVLTALEI